MLWGHKLQIAIGLKYVNLAQRSVLNLRNLFNSVLLQQFR